MIQILAKINQVLSMCSTLIILVAIFLGLIILANPGLLLALPFEIVKTILQAIAS